MLWLRTAIIRIDILIYDYNFKDKDRSTIQM